MKKIIYPLIILSLNLFSSSAFSQQNQNDQFDKQIEEIMKARAEMLQSLMDDDSLSQDFEARMLEIMKKFSGQGMGLGFSQDMLADAPIVGEYDWITTDTHKILKIKVKQIKDHPLDIKIEKGTIKFKGDVETVEGSGKTKSQKKVSFERSFSLPDDVDQTNPEFENKDGEVLVKFKKIKATKVLPKQKVELKPERTPIAPTGDDISI